MGKTLSKNIKVLGLNAGLGVALYPFRDNLVQAIESRSVFHTLKDEQWLSNFGDIPLGKTDFLPMVPNDRADIVISSPDCGSGSVLRMSRSKSYGNHKNNHSLVQFFKGIHFYKPKVFLFENLETLFKSFTEEEFREQLGMYRLVIHNKSVFYFGNSQKSRKRMVIVGIRKDLPKSVDKHFSEVFKVNEPKPCIELYGDLDKQKSSFGHVREHSSLSISIYARRKMSIKDIQLEWRNRLKGKKRWITDDNSNFSTAPGVYRNLADQYPATARKANRQFDHKGLMLTPRQLARIMGIPDKFRIHIDPERKGYWINKARTCVTKGMVYEIPLWFKKCCIRSQHLWN